MILVIEADVADCVALSQTLRREDYSVITAATLDEALPTLAMLHPDVVVIDREPPLAVLQRQVPDAAVLVFSRADTLVVRQLNATQVFRNPAERGRLLATIRHLCRQPK